MSKTARWVCVYMRSASVRGLGRAYRACDEGEMRARAADRRPRRRVGDADAWIVPEAAERIDHTRAFVGAHPQTAALVVARPQWMRHDRRVSRAERVPHCGDALPHPPD